MIKNILMSLCLALFASAVTAASSGGSAGSDGLGEFIFSVKEQANGSIEKMWTLKFSEETSVEVYFQETNNRWGIKLNFPKSHGVDYSNKKDTTPNLAQALRQARTAFESAHDDGRMSPNQYATVLPAVDSLDVPSTVENIQEMINLIVEERRDQDQKG